MGCGKLDAILVKEMVSAPTTVNTDYSTERVEIDNREDAYTIQIVYDSGSSVDMVLELQYSSDGINFSTASTQIITDPSGSHIFDVADTGSRYVRISVTVNAGSIDIQRMLYSGRRRH